MLMSAYVGQGHCGSTPPLACSFDGRRGNEPKRAAAIKKIPCPRLDTLDDAALNRASEAFNRLSLQTLRPTCQSHADAGRHEIDAAVADMLGLHPSILNDLEVLRRLWCEEPSVHGNNQTALRLLEETA